MVKPTREDSTSQLVAEAEALVGKRGTAKASGPSTRQLVREAEQLIGRPGVSSKTRWQLAVAAVLLLAVLAYGATLLLP